MKSNRLLLPSLVVLLLIFSLFALVAYPQQQNKQFAAPARPDVRSEFLHAWRGYKEYAWGHDELKPLSKIYDRAELIAAAREIMSAARYCALITLDSSGRPQARTLDPFPPDENMVVWLGTNPRSRKVAEIRRYPRVTLYYFDRDGQAYVTISGVARLVNDPKEKAKRWKDEWKDFYPERAKDYLLIAVTPERLDVVSVKKGIVGDSLTWKPPSVSFPRFRNPKSKN